MVVPDDVRKCVAFIGLRMDDGTFRFAGSAFFIGHDAMSHTFTSRTWVVTAKHVIENIRKKGVTEAFLRMNRTNGDATWEPVPLDRWFVHPTDTSIDVAVSEMTVSNEFDHLVIPYSICITEKSHKDNEVGLGDEVFITGLFKHHRGSKRNIPIVRVGNLACMTEEKISTTEYGDIDGLLIEARSIGGLSGSPVFVNLGGSRVIGGQLKLATNGPRFLFLGLVHGHYDVKASSIDELVEDDSTTSQSDRVNTGIAIVVPFKRIDGVITSYLSTIGIPSPNP